VAVLEKSHQGPDGKIRCWWCESEAAFLPYHDEEWGFPVDEDQRLFEKICLEGFQAGLSWRTILNKRENFRRAFAGFDIVKVARFTPRRVEKLLSDSGIVRHRGKIELTINNARQAQGLADEFGSLAAYFWRFEPSADSRPKKLTHAALLKMATIPESHALSKDLKKRGWSFVGPTTAYAFMQAMGLVNDHQEICEVRVAAEHARQSFQQPT
jgi:DNA-3-methyladenine glycosylase I